MTILPLVLLTLTHSIFFLTEEAEPAAATEAEAPTKEASVRQPTWWRTSGRRLLEVLGVGRPRFLVIGGRHGSGGSSGRKEMHTVTEELWPQSGGEAWGGCGTR
jgi:hypothetical protein